MDEEVLQTSGKPFGRKAKNQYTLINQLTNSQKIKSEQFLGENHKNSGEFR